MRLSELQQAIRAADPAALLVSPRILNRLIQEDRKLPSFLWAVPHRKCYVVDRQVLFRHVEQEELDLEPDRLLPSTVILLALPAPENLQALKREDAFLKYWRRLFHANVHLALEKKLRDGQLTPADIQDRIEQIGISEFEEVRLVLTQDRYLLPPADGGGAYVEFAAVFLELHYFEANLLPVYFPAIADFERVYRLLLRDVDADALFKRTRLAGAPEPVVRTDNRSDESHDYYWRLVRSAERTARAGNTVRAAILRTRAARVAPAALTESTRAAAEADLCKLMARLQAALQLTDVDVAEWLKDLPALLDKADQGSWPVEAALLFDLQQVCLDHEQDVYALDVVEWLLSGGHRPIKRPLPSQRLVRITKHLRSVAQRLTMARLSDVDREHLARLLQAALDRSEERMRDRYRPVLRDAFQDVGLQPANPPEWTAFHKMIEELLDRVVEYGFLTMSDLRDAVSRNQVKLRDLADPQEFVRGDPLLRLDRRLATLLDGVYRRSEFYLRWMERLTSLGFGTAAGRWVTRNLTIPFGASLVALEGVQLLLDHVGPYFGWRAPVFGPMSLLLGAWFPPSPEPVLGNAVMSVGGFDPQIPVSGLASAALPVLEARPHLPVPGLVAFLVFGLFFLGLIRLPGFREACHSLAVAALRTGRWLFVDVPAWAWSFPLFRRVLQSWPLQLFYWYAVKPSAACAVIWLIRRDAFANPYGAVAIFLAANFILNSRLGRATGEAAAQSLGQFYQSLRAGLIPGLYRFVVNLFKQIVDAGEYVLVTVDEWLRYRAGEGGWSLVVRAVLAFFWFPVSYLARFYMIVLIEPGFNPIKAPMSLLAAKFIYPLTGATMLELFRQGPGWSLASALFWLLALSTLWLLPDAFTFLFWETKENWKLYRANRWPALRPVAVGPRGETVRQLLQPGFHSGTVPHLYARLRHAEREAAVTGTWRNARLCWHALHEVEQTLRRLVTRELVMLVDLSPEWNGHRLTVGQVVLACNRIRLELIHLDHVADPVWLEWEYHARWLVAGVHRPGWLDRLTQDQRQTLAAALVGLYKLAGIDLVREQLRANLPPEAVAYDLTPRALVLWLNHRHGKAILYDLEDLRGQLRPRNPDGSYAPDWPVLEASRLIFAQVPVTWRQWVEGWNSDQAGQLPLTLSAAGVRLLPEPSRSRA